MMVKPLGQKYTLPADTKDGELKDTIRVFNMGRKQDRQTRLTKT
jgi:hypothetical protein